VRRTMHILDVINTASRSSKCIKIIGGWGFATDPLGSLQRSPDPLAGFEGLISKVHTLKGGKERGREERREEGMGVPK